MRTRHRVAHFAALAVLGSGLAACVGNVDVAESTCEITACCVPLTFDAERSRLYRVGDHLDAYLVVTTDGTETDAGTFDAEITVGDAAAQTFTGIGTFVRPRVAVVDAGAGGFAYGDVTPVEGSGLTCGQSVTVELRLRYAEYDATTDTIRCTDAGRGTTVRWQAEVSCPVCPPPPLYGEICDHPPSGGCSVPSGGGPYCGSTPSLSCMCQTGPNGARTWQCAQC